MDLFAEGRKLIESVPPLKRTDAGGFLTHLAWVDPKTPIELITDLGPDRWRQRVLANIAIRLAHEHPSEAEQLLGRIREPLWRRYAGWRICGRMARSDPDRARRIAAGLPDPSDRVYAWTFLADGLRETDPGAAHEALERAIVVIDEMRAAEHPESWGTKPGGVDFASG